jgi:hypothetical protein
MAVIYAGSYVAPANQYDGSASSESVPEGTRFYFPPNVQMPSGLPLLAQMAFQAIQTYGIYISDGSGSMVAYLEHQQPWLNYQKSYYPSSTAFLGSPSYDTLNNLPWTQMVALTPMSAEGIINGSTVPGPPTVTASQGSSGSGQIILNWTAPGSTGTAAISGYAVYSGTKSNGQGPRPATTTTSATTTATSGTTYYFNVTANSSIGTGQASTEVSIAAP